MAKKLPKQPSATSGATASAALSRRQALFAGAAVAGGAAALASRSAKAAPNRGHAWDRTYSGGPDRAAETPGQPGVDYEPTFTPGGSTLPFKVVDGVKIFHLIAEEVDHEFAPGLSAKCWGYNGEVQIGRASCRERV